MTVMTLACFEPNKPPKGNCRTPQGWSRSGLTRAALVAAAAVAWSLLMFHQPALAQAFLLGVSSQGTGFGRFESTPSGAECPANVGVTCYQYFAANSTVVLTAVPDADSVFAGWSGACTGTATCQVVMDANKFVTGAIDAKPGTHYLSVSAFPTAGSGQGAVTSSPMGINCDSTSATCRANYPSGTVVTLAALPAPGSTFTGWGGACSGVGTCAVTMDAARTVTATFAAATASLNSVRMAGAGSGVVASSPAGIKCPGDCTETYAPGTPVTLTATPMTGSVFAGWTGACTGTGACSFAATATPWTVTATFDLQAGLMAISPTSLDFGGQSVQTTAPPMTLNITNAGSASVHVSMMASTNFGVTHNCFLLGVGQSCQASVTFTPPQEGVVAGALNIGSDAGAQGVALGGVGERSLVTHYYRSILRRAPDDGGKTYWNGEAARTGALGLSLNEVWYSMAQSFYFSPEYAAFGRDNAAFVTDLYNTFFNRQPDATGLAHWKGQLDQGMPREVALAAFMFSTEFVNFTQAIFGTTTVRAELNTVTDFYRGLLSRLPDDGGFAFWLAKFRAAQCAGAGAGNAVNTEVESISSLFATSQEYANRVRNNSQYVGDLYNAFLRRGGDLAGVQFWINQITTGARSRENVRQAFVASPEFQARVGAVIAQGCLK